VLDAARGDPLSDSQLERVVKLTLRKLAPVRVESDKAVVACITAAKTGVGDTSRTPALPGVFAPNNSA
jgi:hypothetical protein